MICPNGSLNGIFSSRSRGRIEKSVDGGVIRGLRQLHTRDRPRQRMAKSNRLSRGRREKWRCRSVIQSFHGHDSPVSATGHGLGFWQVGRPWPYKGKVGGRKLSRRRDWRTNRLTLTGAGRHEARVCIIGMYSRRQCFSPCSYPVSQGLPIFPCFTASSQSAHSCRLTTPTTTLHTASRHISLGKSIHQLGDAFICGIHLEPSIDFLPSRCHQSALGAPPRSSHRIASQQAFAVSRHNYSPATKLRYRLRV